MLYSLVLKGNVFCVGFRALWGSPYGWPETTSYNPHLTGAQGVRAAHVGTLVDGKTPKRKP